VPDKEKMNSIFCEEVNFRSLGGKDKRTATEVSSKKLGGSHQ